MIIALKSLSNGRWVCADNSGQEPLQANRDAVGSWEQFEAFVVIDDHLVAIEDVLHPPLPPDPPTPKPPTPRPSVPLTAESAKQIIFQTAQDYPSTLAVYNSDQEALDAAQELLLRSIWRLLRAGFQAGRQRNPSKAISGDKLTVMIDGIWHIYDIMSLGYAGRATTVQFVELTGADYVPEEGISS